MKNLAPIVLFVYNRPWHTEQTLNALMQNELADQSVLYIYADGQKSNEDTEEVENVNNVRRLIRMKKWCNEVVIIESDTNKGLAQSIIKGVTEVVNKYGKIIVLEDDLVTSIGFLKFMNDALVMYEKEEKVYHISGYMFPVKGKLPTSFFYKQTSCWGWATWKDRWTYLNKDATKLLAELNTTGKINEADIDGTGQFIEQLNDNIFGKIKTWAVFWHFSVFIKGGLSLHPGKSLVYNTGNDGSGTNAEANDLFKVPLTQFIELRKKEIEDYKKVYPKLRHFYKPKNNKLKQDLKKILKFVIPNQVLNGLKSKFTTKGKNERIYDRLVKTVPRFQHTDIPFLNQRIKIVDIASFQFIKKELFEQEIYKFSANNKRPYIIDCGANIGLSVLYFKQLYPEAEILALEPDANVFKVLEENIKRFKLSNVTILKKACWNEETTLKFFSEGADGGRAAQQFDNTNIVEVEAIRLSKFLTRKVDFLKIDIEGAEFEVINEIEHLLHNVERIFVEYHSFIGQEQFLPELLSILKNVGFRINLHHIGIYSPNPFQSILEYNKMDLQLNIYGYRI